MSAFETTTVDGTEYVSHSLLKNEFIEARDYQTELAERAVGESSLVALPTGTGKTVVSLLVTAERLLEARGMTLFLAPTKPLAEQQYEFYKEALDIADEEIVLLTSDTHRPVDRVEVWEQEKSVVFATPQIVENDIISDRVNLDAITYLTVDECHKATGDYAYTFIAEKYWMEASNPLVTGLSASPGSSKDDILQICKNLGLTNVEVLTEDDEELQEYLHTVDTDVVKIDMDEELLEMRELLQEYFKKILKEVKEAGYINTASKTTSNKKLRQAQGRISSAIDKGESDAYKCMSLIAEAMKLQQAIKVLDTQGVESFLSYMKGVMEEAESSDGSKASARLASNPKVKEAVDLAEEYDQVHPKKSMLRALTIDSLTSGGQVLIFTEYRDTAEDLTDFFNDHDNINAHKFVGQQNKKNSSGMTQNQQQEVIQQFRDGEYDILVATSIAEEGLDIPEVDLVVFYEPVASPLRKIQRAGRTGRAKAGAVKILVGKGTMDEGMYYASKNKEESMETDMRNLASMQDEINAELSDNQSHLQEHGETKTEEEDEQEDETEEPEDEMVTLDDFDTSEEEAEEEAEDVENVEISATDDDIEIVFDSRELSSNVAKNLSKDDDVSIREETLEVGDYIVSDTTAIERKEIDDFLDTLTGGDRSLFEQVRDMVNAYPNSVLIIEGDVDELYTKRNIHPNAIRGALSSVILDYGVSVVHTPDEHHTGKMITQFAKREQEDEETVVDPHGSKETATLTEQQEYIVSSFNFIGPITAQKLLEHFGTILDVMNAEKDGLQEVDGVGEKTAEKIYSTVREGYAPASS